ncbi:MAG: phage holin family protein [Acidobacteria bacterium]|nr:phage holin family protein [Acidobacteriota bacterium]MCI0724068.1 phage holin family protein [Acidobacteriota bacterium]
MSRETAPLPLSRLPELLERLYDSLAEFLDAKLALFRKELLEEGESLLRRAFGVAAAVLVALVGFMVLTGGLVLTLDIWIRNVPLSCLIVGGTYFAVGAGMAGALAKNVTRRPLRKTRIELEKDKQWIKAQASDI